MIVTKRLSNEEKGEVHGKRKVDVGPVVGFLKVDLDLTRMSVQGENNVNNE